LKDINLQQIAQHKNITNFLIKVQLQIVPFFQSNLYSGNKKVNILILKIMKTLNNNNSLMKNIEEVWSKSILLTIKNKFKIIKIIKCKYKHNNNKICLPFNTKIIFLKIFNKISYNKIYLIKPRQTNHTN
jgi:hypothetical protein